MHGMRGEDFSLYIIAFMNNFYVSLRRSMKINNLAVDPLSDTLSLIIEYLLF